MPKNRLIRIGGASGSASDRRHAISTFAANYPTDPVDVIIGDWLSEANMATLASKKSLSSTTPNETFYERTFLQALIPALPDIIKHKIKIVVNAGASDTAGLARDLRNILKEKGLEKDLNVAWVEGDDCLDVIKSKLASSKDVEGNQGKNGDQAREAGEAENEKKKSKWQTIRNTPMPKHRDGLTIFDAWMEGEDVSAEVRAVLSSSSSFSPPTSISTPDDFRNICTGEMLRTWEFKDAIIAAQAYLGGTGMKLALQNGADIVICGRVSDASLVVGAAAWWHSWEEERNLEELACALIAGHLIECSTYVCGGNWSGFRELEGREGGKGWLDIGYPIVEIGGGGEVVVTKQIGTGGVVSVDTCKAQLLYEIQGPWYFNSDVTAVIDQIAFEHISTNRIRMTGVKALPPPPTTKVGMTAHGGYQAEVHWFLVGLDIPEKARMLELQIRDALGDTSRFHVLKFTLNGTAAENPTDQNAATVDFRVFAQARKEADIATDKFLKLILDLIMCSYPGATFHLDFRQGIPKPIQEYFVTFIPQSDIQHVAHMQDGKVLAAERPKVTKIFPRDQPHQEESIKRATDSGETIRGPLGWIVQARSGDKGSNANVGFWVRHEDEYDWMRSLLSTEIMRHLLADEYKGGKIDRFELPNIWAVHFLLHDHLDRGVSCSSTYDFLAKNVAEYLRSRHVDLPKHFLARRKL